VRKAAESIGLTIGMAVAVMFYMFMGAVAMVGIAIMSVPDLLRAFVRFLVYWDVEIFRKAFWPIEGFCQILGLLGCGNF